jgi:hypothetical protein
MYRFGDGSPFPFDENFLDILSAAIEACSAVFGAAAELDEHRERAREAKKEADEEVRRLVSMEKAIEAAVFPMKPSVGKNAPTSQQTAHRLMATARQAIAASKREVQQRADAIAQEPRSDRSIERVRVAMAAMFEQQSMPGTSWALRWQADGNAAQAEAAAQSGRFRTAYDLALDGPWNGPVRVSTLVDQLRITLPRKRRWSAPRPGVVALERCALVRYERSADHHYMVLRQHVGRASAGWTVLLPDAEHAGVTVQPIDAAGEPDGGAVAIEGQDAAALYRLGEVVTGALNTMRDHKRRLRELRIGDTLLEQLDPGIIGQAILTQLASLIRQTRQKSRVPGELIVKRDIGDGRREELFIPRAALERRFATLPPEYRRYFDDAGLGRDHTNAEVEPPDGGDSEVRTVPAAPARVLTAAPETRPTITMAS